MIDPVTLQRVGYGLLFAALAGVILFVRLLPLDGNAGGVPVPDVVLLLAFAWVVRRPDYVPVLLFAGLMVLMDMMFLRPPGVRAALAVIGLEVLRARSDLLRTQSALSEWTTVAVVLLAMLLAERVLLGVAFVAQVSFGLAVYELVVNVAFYPVVVGLSIWAFRVRRPIPGEHAAEARAV